MTVLSRTLPAISAQNAMQPSFGNATQLPVAVRDACCAHVESNSGPCYVYDFDDIQRQWSRLSTDAPARSRICYAAMANDHPQLLEWLRDSGGSVFVGSASQLKLVHDIGFPRSNIVVGLTNYDCKSAKETAACAGTIICANRSDWEALRCVDDDVQLLLRVAARIESSTTKPLRRMGVPVAHIEREWRSLCASDRRPVGIHAYNGTNWRDLRELGRMARKVVDIATSLPNASIVDVGGGFGIPSKNDLHKNPFSDFWREVGRLPDNLEIWVEPGRSVVGGAGYFASCVRSVEQCDERIVVGVNASVSQFPRPLLFNPSLGEHPLWVVRKGECVLGESSREGLIVGNTTYSGDVLYEGKFCDVRVGDVIVLGNAGAYCRSSVTRFLGGDMPTEIILRRG